MVATFVMAAALAANGYDPVAEIPVHKTPGPAFKIPCKVDGVQAVEGVQLYVSDNRGKTWTLYEEITPDKTAFTFLARKPGEYWFTARLKKKDGTLDPASPAQFVVMQRVEVEIGTGNTEPLLAQPPRPAVAEIAKELDEDLTRVEMELIRQEIKRLSESKKFTPETGDKIDRLRIRLRDIQDRLRSDREGATNRLQANPPTVYPHPFVPAPRVENELIPPTITPTRPPAPAPSEAPMPHVPGPR